MRLFLAFKAFFKAFREPEKAKEFVEGTCQAADTHDQAHLRLLTILQHSGRLIDFLKEDISQFNDAQVGAAVRKIHQDCSKILEETVTIRPIREENEGDKIKINLGYDPALIKVVGKIKGEPPFTGTLVHKGWKAHKRSLPKKIGEQQNDVICPAEVEVV
jgi:Domain of unknown function (DUF2760)